jgi:alkane 1-monooxygenase
MQFYIEHNRGHHKHVATPGDPSTAKYRQSVYAFWWQTVTGTWISAWKIAHKEAQKKNRPLPFFNNEMFLFQLIQVLFVLAIFYFLGITAMLCFLAAALMGGLLLETVQYIEHYGLTRYKKEEGSYERVNAQHSWNSNHVFGRLMLFELSRHSDHHYLASRKYQVLRHLNESPQMPTGYPGMIILSLLPPLFFNIMDKEMKKYGVLPAA